MIETIPPHPQMTMQLHDLQFHVQIGCQGLGDDERGRRQPVRFDVSIRFASLPAVFATGDLQDTVGYHDLCGVLENLACSQPWFLLEQLAQQSFAALRAMIPADAKLSLTVTKLKPMVLPLLRGGASIQLADA